MHRVLYQRHLPAVVTPLTRCLFALVVGAVSSFCRNVHADVQAHAGLRGSVCHVAPQSERAASTHFCTGLVLDAHFGRERNTDFGVGPMLAVTTAGFWDVRFGGGGSALIPLHPDMPLVLDAGVFAHETRGLSLGASLFWGFRSYNFHGPYNLAGGLFTELVQDFDRDRATVVSLGFEVDAAILAWPVLLLTGA